MAHFYLGIMSGTSMDGIDLALVDFDQRPVSLIDFNTAAYPPALANILHDLCQPQANELVTMGHADRMLGATFGQAVNDFLKKNKVAAADVVAIGCHGQTIRHVPAKENGFTLQIGDPHTLATTTGIEVIADFRRKDMALGGEGAPLVPAFHQAVFQSPRCNRAIINIGGISNITYLPADMDSPVIGFDTGPGNTLLDAWCRKHTGKEYDKAGAWAATGKPDEDLLSRLMSHPYFARPAPKSTGRELFNLTWLEQHIEKTSGALSPQCVQATLTMLTACSIAAHVNALEAVEEVYICGGGAFNDFLMECLEVRLHECELLTTDELGIPGDGVEAIAFAWLAYAYKHKLPGNIPSVTGASRAAVLGASFIPD